MNVKEWPVSAHKKSRTLLWFIILYEGPHIFTRHLFAAFGSTKNTTTWQQFCTNLGDKWKTTYLLAAYIWQASAGEISSFGQLACYHRLWYYRTYPRKGKEGMFCSFPEGKPHHSDNTSWFWWQMNRPKKFYVAVKSFFARFSVQVESTLGKQRCSDVFFIQAAQWWTRSWQTSIESGSMDWTYNIWRQDVGLKPNCLDPLTLGWWHLDKNY